MTTAENNRPSAAICVPEEETQKGIKETFLKHARQHCVPPPANSPPINASSGTLAKADVTIVAKTPKELLPTQDVVSSLHFYSSSSTKSTPESVKATAPACPTPTPPSQRWKLDNRKLALAQQLSKGEITAEEYERAMCLLWDRPKLSAEGDWVMIEHKECVGACLHMASCIPYLGSFSWVRGAEPDWSPVGNRQQQWGTLGLARPLVSACLALFSSRFPRLGTNL
ncbi:hypothetical protein B0T21DRAFT_350387 [Apiosordaria backusii]|uniref:Uncharacterized protein n=1 Tax=Apiosordaria backusii TaxID=314023 RepID=A0AA40B237_9PEZI|nr:hypothetical protein B0T21DRAFT_350387 [Apiosordaria backusii]